MTNTAATTRRYSNRDRTGRFVAMVNADAMRVEGRFFNDTADTCHGHDRCGNVTGEVTVSDTQDGFMCPACVQVDVPAWVASRNVATVSGHATCACCTETMRVTAFPTMTVANSWRVRGTVCRKCVKAGRAPVAPVEMVAKVAA